MRKLLLLLLASPVSVGAQPLAWSWAWAAGGAGSEVGYVSVAPTGAVHLLGSYENTIDAHGITLTSAGQADAFVQQLDPVDGSVQWTAQAHHTGNLNIHAMAYRSTGELIVSGSMAHNGDAAQFGPFSIPGQEFGIQAFVAGLSPAGDWNWVSAVADPVSTEGFLVEVDANDNILLGCRYGAWLAVVRFTGPGVQGWMAQASTNGSSVDAYAMDVLPSGDLVVTGRCYGTGTFGTHSITVGGIYYDAYVARLSADGIWQWVVQAGGSHWDKGFGVCADAQGDVYVAGTYRNTATFGPFQLTATGSNNDGWLAKLDGTGQWLWAEDMASIAYMEVYGMDLNPAGDRLALTGIYAFSTPTLGGIPLPAPVAVGNDVYVAEYTTSGQVLSALGLGSTGNDRGYSAVYGADGGLFVAGVHGGDMLAGTYPLPAVAATDLWVGRLDPDLSTGVANGYGDTAMEGLVQYDPLRGEVRFTGFEAHTWRADLYDPLGRQLATGSTARAIPVPQEVSAGMVLVVLTHGDTRSTQRVPVLR